METTEKAIDVLNDLIQINNDRIAGFGKAIKDLKENDEDLKAIFQRLADESRNNAEELTMAVSQRDGEPETGTSGSGTIHRAWIDVKATFTGHDRKSVLEECERGEDAIKKAYKSALEPENELPADLYALLTKQQTAVEAGHNEIKALRDSQA